MTRKALGRGLSALLHEVETAPVAEIQEIAIDLIDPNPFQPRRAFPEHGLDKLAASIRSTGVIQPVLLRHGVQSGDRYQLVAGERRWRAAKLAGLKGVPAVVRELADRDALELALTENLLREDLNALEVAKAYEGLQTQFQLSHEEIAERLGFDRSTVTNTLRLLKLPPSVQQLIGEGSLTAGHARALLGLESTEAQVRMAELIDKRGLSVRGAEMLVALEQREAKAHKAKAREGTQDSNTRAAVLEMERALGTRVRLTGDSNRGAIEISYFSGEDLNRLYQYIVKR
jgi:ParB family transcriptional regulator, chromosome partitioning protein